MANNHLYIKDTETGERIHFAKSYGDGWYISNPDFVKQFEEWANHRDILACCGDKETKLILETDP